MNPLAVQVSARAALGGKQLAADGVKDHARNDLAPKSQSQGHAKHREPVREVRRAIERIHVPAVVRGRFPSPALLGDDGVGRIVFPQAFDNQGFGAPVGLGDQVGGSFVGNLFGTLELVGHERAGFARDLDGFGKVIFHHPTHEQALVRQLANSSAACDFGLELTAGFGGKPFRFLAEG